MNGKKLSKPAAERVRQRSPETRELHARLAPLEELDEVNESEHANASSVVAQENGAIVVGVEQTDFAKEVVEAEEQNGGWRLEPVVIVIVGLLLAFIAFIAWQISLMPAERITN